MLRLYGSVRSRAFDRSAADWREVRARDMIEDAALVYARLSEIATA